jgi:SAM-dependent methyltransferase
MFIKDSTNSVRDSYDLLADEYARRIYGELKDKPFDRQLLDKFVKQTGSYPICDLGCGPGHVAAYVRDQGATVIGIDLSSAMVKRAQQLNPGILFQQGDMMSLAFPENSLGGIVAFYSICHVPEDSLTVVFRQIYRVLRANGMLLISFHIGQGAIHREEMWGAKVNLDFFLYSPESIQQYLKQSGFTIEESLERGPYSPEVEYQSRRSYIAARKVAARGSLNSSKKA